MIVIYELTCTKNGKSYIGKNNTEKTDSNYPAGRFWDESENESLVADALKFGSDNFDVKILLETEVLEEAVMNELRGFLILKRNTLTPEGYNKTPYIDQIVDPLDQ